MHIRCGGEGERTVWDDAKGEANLRSHRMDFAGPDAAFDGRFILVAEDRRHDYGERRSNALVVLNGVVLTITFTPRGAKQRIISTRLASRGERSIHDARREDG